MESLKVAALVCLVGLAAAAEEKDTKERKNRDVGAILGGKFKTGLDRGYLPPQKYYPGSPFGQQVCDCRTGSPISGYPGSSYPGSSYPGGYPGGAGYPGAGGVIGGGIGGGAIGGGFDDTVQVYPRPGGAIGPNRLGPNGLGPDGFGPNGLGPNGFGPNSLGPNGFGPNGLGPNGLGPNGLGPNGLGPNGLGPNGLGPNGLGPNGIGANGYSSGSAFGVSSSYGVPTGPSGAFSVKGGVGPTGSSGIGGFGATGSSGLIGATGSSGLIGSPRPGLDGPFPGARPGSSIGIASSSYTSSGSVGLIGGAEGYNYDKPSVAFP